MRITTHCLFIALYVGLEGALVPVVLAGLALTRDALFCSCSSGTFNVQKGTSRWRGLNTRCVLHDDRLDMAVGVWMGSPQASTTTTPTYQPNSRHAAAQTRRFGRIGVLIQPSDLLILSNAASTGLCLVLLSQLTCPCPPSHVAAAAAVVLPLCLFVPCSG
jgi:hypothetical protein